MEIEKSGLDHELRSMEHSFRRLFSSPESSAGLEFSAQPLPQTRKPKIPKVPNKKSPNRRTKKESWTKMTRKDLSNPPPPPSSEVVVDTTPTPFVEDGSKQITSDWKAELEGLKLEFDDDQLGFRILPYDDDSVDYIEFPEVHPYCDICGRDHYPSGCAYLTEIPHDVKLANDRKYVIVCGCGKTIVDRCCPGSCVSWRPRHVVSKISLEIPYINKASIELARQRSIEHALKCAIEGAQKCASRVESNLA